MEHVQNTSKYDPGLRRRAQRRGREKGCWVYIAADELARAGMEPGGLIPWYRAWGTRGRGVMVRLYTAP